MSFCSRKNVKQLKIDLSVLPTPDVLNPKAIEDYTPPPKISKIKPHTVFSGIPGIKKIM